MYLTINVEVRMLKWQQLITYLTPYGAKRGPKNGRAFNSMIYNKPTTDKNTRIIKKIRKKFSKIELIVIKQSNSGSFLGNSKPCHMCGMMMKTLNFKNIHYTDKHGSIISERVSKFDSMHVSQLIRNLKKIE